MRHVGCKLCRDGIRPGRGRGEVLGSPFVQHTKESEAKIIAHKVFVALQQRVFFFRNGSKVRLASNKTAAPSIGCRRFHWQA
jgi:aromatic ring hydroxylase